MNSLTIVGAGPKAVAIAAKAHALSALGITVPEITVVEPRGIGANWRAVGGWTDGRHLLGTPPAKDVGFPYRTRIAGPQSAQVDAGLLEHSWNRFLIETDRYADWVDRGAPFPRHEVWAEYLNWVAERIDLTVVQGRVVKTAPGDSDAQGNREWDITVEAADGGTRTIHSGALLITGPGRSDRRFADLDGVLSVAGFWAAIAEGTLFNATRTAVIGGGETAASIIAELFRHNLDEISVVSPLAAVFSRGESQFENRLYTDPDKWATLDAEERREVIRRTDRGVFSVRVQQDLHWDDRVGHLHGRVTDITEAAGGRLGVHIVDSFGEASEHPYDLVIDARGNSPLWFTGLLDEEAMAELSDAVGGHVTAPALERSIAADMSVHGLQPKLLLPSLAGFNQGPGFANLSCLGELSDRVLGGLMGLDVRPQRSTTAI
ncbi:lysine N(6)-hydroxylase/L-ornithine N(5)-oxygenase family protein [Corynebacterium sp. TAE3-ERU12]|uniref:SidA/IucD/PvdA family monooxygenase n=1 Tax=Corynebacterium sp. TAE3-ERU12 TaxID=2849491 RepID=UPI001C4605E6|nr:SidA/IucD/PvdA family monooxygenase [Corynebacterium sp. TAE3-ERU12]MBV7295163.1 lysine N(6)-hydroxylase/L-ornithine N(5)-oxygenase family protein [Corynebacterium sp. TAE3-ERU12]